MDVFIHVKNSMPAEFTFAEAHHPLTYDGIESKEVKAEITW